MDIEKSLKSYKKRAVFLAIGKSAFYGAIIGAAVNFMVALILWFFKLKILTVILLSVGSGISGGILSAALFYFLKCKPNTKTVASMVDRCGLEERVITMCEMEQDDSEIARLQREDAKKKLDGVSAKQLKLSISAAAVILFAVVCSMSVAMTTLSSLSSAGIIKSGSEILDSAGKNDSSDEENGEENLEYVELNYLAGEGGTISGQAYQKIVKGRDATPVVAVPDEGYLFVQWDDGQMNAERWDWSVTSDKTVMAIFQKKEAPGGEEGGDDQDGEKGEGQGGDKGNGESGDGSEGGEGEGSEGENGDGGEGQGGEGQQGEGQSGQAGQGAEGAKGDGGETQSMGGQGQGGGPNGEYGEQGEGQNGQGQGGEGENGEGSQKPDQAGGSGSSSGGNQQGQGGEGGHGGRHDGSGQSSQGEGGGAGRGKPDNNNVMDGGTDYKDAIDYEKEKENLENEDLPPELKDALDNFFEGMKP